MLVEVLEDIGFQLQLGRLTKKILTRSNLERRHARDRAVRPRSSSPMIATLIRPKDARHKSYTSRGGLAWDAGRPCRHRDSVRRLLFEDPIRSFLLDAPMSALHAIRR